MHEKTTDFSVVLTAPQVGLEPTTLRLTAECSAIELLRNVGWFGVWSWWEEFGVLVALRNVAVRGLQSVC